MYFMKFHNRRDTRTIIFPFDIYWSMAMKFSTFDITYDHAINYDVNRASIRYVERVRMSDGSDFELAPSNTYPFNHSIIQHEHALVSVDNKCKIKRWDQYGDDKEQDEVTDAMDLLMADQGVKCNIGLAPPWNC